LLQPKKIYTRVMNRRTRDPSPKGTMETHEKRANIKPPDRVSGPKTGNGG